MESPHLPLADGEITRPEKAHAELADVVGDREFASVKDLLGIAVT